MFAYGLPKLKVAFAHMTKAIFARSENSVCVQNMHLFFLYIFRQQGRLFLKRSSQEVSDKAMMEIRFFTLSKIVDFAFSQILKLLNPLLTTVNKFTY